MFDIRKPIHTGGELDEDLAEEYKDGLMREFADSPEAKPVIEKHGGVGWAHTMMDYGISYLGTTPAKMTVRDFNEVVFELFPRKVSVESERAPEIIDELKAFWSFVQRQYQLPNAGKILAALDGGTADTLQRELADPRNYGMGKSFVMQGMKAGYDMTTPEGLNAFQAAYNASLLNQRLQETQPSPDDLFRTMDRLGEGMSLLPPLGPPVNREKKRKQRKAQRQARKRNRR